MGRKREIKTIDGEIHYKCSTCKEFFGISNFYSAKKSPDGIKSECKKCHQLTSLATRNLDNHRDKNKIWMKAYSKRPEVMARNLERSRVRNKSWNAKARALANKAVDLGFLVRPKICSSCGGGIQIHAHHEDYNKPLDVIWLCTDCHGLRHRKTEHKGISIE